MRYGRLAFLGAGLTLLAVTLLQADLDEVGRHVAAFGVWGVVFVTLLFLCAYAIDAWAWLLTLIGIPLTTRWWWRLFEVRTVGEAWNDITPFASLGGEPVKSMLLKTHYGIGYRRSGASLVLAKTTTTVSLVVFLASGFALSLGTTGLPAAYKLVAGIGFGVLTSCTVGFFLVQRLRLTSGTLRWLHRGGLGGVERALHELRAFDEQLVAFYVGHGRRLLGALALGFASWMIGIVEIWLMLRLLGQPATFADAWVIEALSQLVRAAAFFVPAGIGIQEGAFLVILSSMFGSPALGVAIGVLRRCRQVAWLAIGIGLSWLLSLRPRAPAGGDAVEEAGG